jgi:hypothetical protein
MNLKFYMEKLRASESFKKFSKENPSAFFCSCFFSIDFAGDDNKAHLDYFIPETKQMFGFQLEKDCEKMPLEKQEGFLPEKLNEKINFELKDIEKILFDRMKEDKILDKVQKIFISLQRTNKKDMLVGTIFISAMGMITFQMELASKKIISFNKKSFMDFFRILKK